MNYILEYNSWLNSNFIDEDTRRELLLIKGNEKEIEDRFFKHLEFGTAGLRGIIGAGINRMNIYTVAKSTQGLANYIKRVGEKNENSVVIAYDSRHMSYEFALKAALVLNGNRIKAYLFESLRPTPELSFAVRELGAIAGIVITASHNPPQYNGFKVYWKDGGQITPDRAKEITSEVNRIKDFSHVKMLDQDRAVDDEFLVMIGKEIDEKYIQQVVSLCQDEGVVIRCGNDLNIVYTPLYGTGNKPVRNALRKAGFENINVVREQELPNPDFPTAKSPNPENPQALKLAIEKAKRINADIVLGTDPDCDRVGIAVRNDRGEFVVLTGNQIGALLVEYILFQKKNSGLISSEDVVIKSVVTSEMGRVIAKAYGVDTVDTLTGFKFIAEKIEEFSRTGEKNFVFGYEESNGYLTGNFVRDKDGVIACLLICEMALHYKLKGFTLYQALEGLFERYGYFMEDVKSIKQEGKEGEEKIKAIMEYFRDNLDEVNQIFSGKVKEFRDYLKGVNFFPATGENLTSELPSSNVLYYKLKDDCWFCIRPSGTEPRIKIYFSVVGEDKNKAHDKLQYIQDKVMNLVDRII